MSMEKLLIPGMVNPQLAYRDRLRSRVDEETSWLDLGCGHKLFSGSLPDSEHSQYELARRAKLVVGIDGDLNALRENRLLRNRIVGSVEKLPFCNRSFDLVTANMVVEHVCDPEALLYEINRVLSTSGIFIFHTPNIRNYKIMIARAFPGLMKKRTIKYLQDRDEADVYPTCYRINSPDAIKKEAIAAGFELAEIDFMQSPADSVMLGPLVIFELLLMKFLSLKRMSGSRSNIIVALRKVREP